MLFQLASVPEVAQTLGGRLRALRLQQSITQGELAARSGISARALRNLEVTGQATMDSFLRVIKTLGRSGDLEDILDLKVQSIKAMEEASRARQRAPRRTTHTPGPAKDRR